MNLRKYRWSKVYESAEEELTDLLAVKQITAERWDAEPGEPIAPYTMAADSRLWCAEGSLIIFVDGARYSLQPGDVMDIPSGMTYEGTAGFGGCACYQSPARSAA